MVITVVAPELWITAVPAAPIPTPINLFDDAFENIALSLLELADSRFELIIWQAIRNIPIPDIKYRMAEMISVVPISLQ